MHVFLDVTKSINVIYEWEMTFLLHLLQQDDRGEQPLSVYPIFVAHRKVLFRYYSLESLFKATEGHTRQL